MDEYNADDDAGSDLDAQLLIPSRVPSDRSQNNVSSRIKTASSYDVNHESPIRGKGNQPWTRKQKVICAVVALVLIGLFVMLLHSGVMQPMFMGILKFVHGLGPWGPLVLLLLIIVLVPLCIPTTPLNIGAGFLFSWLGLPVITIAALIGASISFFISRKFYMDAAERRLANVKIYRTLNLLFMEDHGKFSWQSTKIILLTRASPLFPFPLINYANGLTHVAYSSYALATLVGMLPWQIVDIYLGAELKNIAEIGKPRSTGYFVGVLVFTVVITILVTAYAKRMLRQMEAMAKQRQQEDENSDDNYPREAEV